MSITETLGSVRFPVHKSGGYQVTAVDALLSEVGVQVTDMEKKLTLSEMKEKELLTALESLNGQLTSEVEKVTHLESRIYDLESTPLPADFSVEISELRRELSELTSERDSMKAELVESREQSLSDEKHIVTLETYADEVEAVSESLRLERDKIRSDAEVAIQSLMARIPKPSESNSTPTVQSETVYAPAVVEVEVPEPTPPVPVNVDNESIEVEPLSGTPDEETNVVQHVSSITTPVTSAPQTLPSRPRLVRRKQ